MNFPKGKKYHQFSYMERYGMRLQRLVLNAGFSCPNRDGTLSSGGCTFCDNAAFHPCYTAGKSISEQLDEGIRFHSGRRSSGERYLAYFQAFSNTYAPLELLQERYSEALSHPMVAGLVIGTRPDCVDEEKLDYIASLQEQGKIVELEYGIESVYDHTLQRVNRGHDFATACKAIKESAARGIDCGAHLILGLPGESLEMLLAVSDKLNALPVSSVKFHQLQIIKGTAMEREFKEKPEDFLRLDACGYIELLTDIIERLRPDIAVARIASSVPPRFTDAPWGLLKHDELMRMLEESFEKRGSHQGIYY